MEIKIKSYSSQSSLLSSILFFILGAILFTSADKLLNVVSIIIGTIFATTGTISLIIYFIQSRKPNNIPKKGNLIYGIIAFIFAIIFIGFHNVVEQAIRFIVGGWILLTGIIRLINVLSMTKKDTKFWQLLLVSAALIFIGIYTIVIELFGLDIIGIIMMAYAGIEIIGYILYSKDKPEQEPKEGTTTLLVPEDTKQDDKNENVVVKDVKEKKKLLKRPKKEK
jgi:uncharacterized membrane protein HdeD (DUF308 family)